MSAFEKQESNLFSCMDFLFLQGRSRTCSEDYHKKNNSQQKQRTPCRINFDATGVMVAGSGDSGDGEEAIAARSGV